MSMAIALYIIPKSTGNVLWSKLLSVTGIIMIFFTLTPFTSYTGQGLGSDDNILTIQIALWSTLALIPIFATSISKTFNDETIEINLFTMFEMLDGYGSSLGFEMHYDILDYL